MSRRTTRIATLGLGLVMVAGLAAQAQVPQPRIPDVRQRSGLITRYQPIVSHLPVDRDRDILYGAKWKDRDPHNRTDHRNSFKDGGMYGEPLSADCTKSVYPYFYGSPGRSTIGPDCEGCHEAGRRILTNAVHPFKPVGSYYSGGSYVPIYDLDYFVPGPGPFPWSHFFKRTQGG